MTGYCLMLYLNPRFPGLDRQLTEVDAIVVHHLFTCSNQSGYLTSLFPLSHSPTLASLHVIIEDTFLPNKHPSSTTRLKQNCLFFFSYKLKHPNLYIIQQISAIIAYISQTGKMCHIIFRRPSLPLFMLNKKHC
jgi:hypothetical protein